MSQVHNLVIIGSGPAGYTAAIYAARAKLNPVVFAGDQPGGQLMSTTVVENFPGFITGKMGPELMDEMKQQAERFGAQVKYSRVDRVDFSDKELKKVYIKQKGEEIEYLAKAVIISTGAESIMLGIEGEQQLLGRGVATCAVCDAPFYRDKATFVVGGGDSAMEDALALTKFADSVTIVHRREQFKASKIMQDRVLNNPKVKVLWNTVVKKVEGDGKLSHLIIKQDGQERKIAADGMFLAIGHRPNTSLFTKEIELDDHGYIVTRQSLTKRGVELASQALNQDDLVQFPTMTTVEGVFAAGDVVDVRYKQAITAAGQGCAAALDVEKWLESEI